MGRRYLALLVEFTFRQSVLFTDRVSLFLGPFVTAILWLAGDKMDNAGTLAALGTVITVAAVLILRLLAAPYFIWKEDQNRVESLNTLLNLPDTQMRDAMLSHRVAVRTELGQRLASYQHTVVAFITAKKHRDWFYSHEKYKEDFNRINVLITEISYDAIVRVAARNLLIRASRMISDAAKGKDVRNLVPSLAKQAKLTLKVIHKAHPLGDAVAFAELESYLHEIGLGVRGDEVPEPQLPQDIE